MPQPITDGAVEIHGRDRAHTQQLFQGYHAFLTWAADQNLVERKKIGLRVMIFLFVLAGLLYFTKKRVWEAAH